MLKPLPCSTATAATVAINMFRPLDVLLPRPAFGPGSLRSWSWPIAARASEHGAARPPSQLHLHLRPPPLHRRGPTAHLKSSGENALAAVGCKPRATPDTHVYQVSAVHMIHKLYTTLVPAVKPMHHAPILVTLTPLMIMIVVVSLQCDRNAVNKDESDQLRAHDFQNIGDKIHK